MKFPIGVIIDSFRTDIPTAVKKAAKVGAQGIQVYATSGEMSPEELVGSKRADFRKLVEDNGLVISALCGDLGGGFGNKEENPWRVEKSKRIIELAKELGTDIVTTHIGVVPEDSSHERYKIMQEACFELSRFAEQPRRPFRHRDGTRDFSDAQEVPRLARLDRRRSQPRPCKPCYGHGRRPRKGGL